VGGYRYEDEKDGGFAVEDDGRGGEDSGEVGVWGDWGRYGEVLLL